MSKELFKEFEQETKKRVNGKYEKLYKCIEELKSKRINPYFSEYGFIDVCKRIRDFDSHNPKSDNYYSIADETIKKLESITEEVKHPFTVASKATKNIYSKNINDKVLESMKDMNEKNYTHIPIYSSEDNKKLVGIFSENSVFQYIMEDKIIEIDDNTTFKDIIKCIDIKKSKEVIKFVSKNELYDDVVNDFIKEFHEGQKLSCVMITDHGLPTEKVIGILTAWDVIGR